MENHELAIKLVCNYALNDLRNVSEEEFNTEKEVVLNEIRRYSEDKQGMFFANNIALLNNYDIEDNILGIPENLNKVTLSQCKIIKSIFLQNTDCVYNIVYDVNNEDINYIIEKIIEEKSHFNNNLYNSTLVTKSTYDKYNLVPRKSTVKKIDFKSEQSLTSITLDVVDNYIVSDISNEYLSYFAPDTSLDDIIRKDNGLTYGVGFYISNISGVPFLIFSCDVEKGNEKLLLSLFKESINRTVDSFTIDKYNTYMETVKLNRNLELLNQKCYTSLFEEAIWYSDSLKILENTLSLNIDSVYQILDNEVCSYDNMLNYFNKVKECVNNNDYSIVTNY
jgi:predicted Zn-dependent peptidase